MFTLTFAASIRVEDGAWNLPGAPFLLAAAILVCALGVASQVGGERALDAAGPAQS